MSRVDPHDVFPLVIHEVSVRDYYCCEYAFPDDLFDRPDVGLHVIYHRSDEDRINYTIWCYIKNVPLMRLVSVASLAFTDTSLVAVNKLITDRILHDETLLGACQRFLDWIDEVDDLEQLENNPHGTEPVERYDCFEFYLPGCTYDRPDIKLQAVYRATGEKVKYSVWCHLDHYPLLGYIGSGEFKKTDDDMGQAVFSRINEDKNILQLIQMFLNLVENIQL